MQLTEKWIKTNFTAADYQNGKKYRQLARVTNYEQSEQDGRHVLSCNVQGTEKYAVNLKFGEGEIITGKCTCPRYADRRCCKHVVAALLEYAARNPVSGKPQPQKSKSDLSALDLLHTYLNQAEEESKPAQSGRIRLVPIWVTADDNGVYPCLQFMIGESRLYVVRNVNELLHHIRNQESVRYGKQLEFVHRMEAFDTLSQQLISLLMDEQPDSRSTLPGIYSRFSRMYGYSSYYDTSREKNLIRLTGSTFDRFFALMKDQPMADCRNNPMRLVHGDPPVTIQVKPQENGMKLHVECEAVLFGNAQTMYAEMADEHTVFQCSRKFRQQLLPIVKLAGREICFDEADIPTFCSCVLPAVESGAVLDDEAGLLEKYLPDECACSYYFDCLPEGALTVRAVFRYGDTEIPYAAQDPTDIAAARVKRDARRERLLVQPIQELFLEPDVSCRDFHIYDDDAIYDFLSGGMNSFAQLGEVFVSERLQGRRVVQAPVHIGVSVSNGLMKLDLDTGDFPMEELESLYASLIRRQRFHKLSDGRFVDLDGGDYEKLAELTHMLRLSPKQLGSGSVSLPAFRAPYVEEVLQESPTLDVQRDQVFQQMIRSFETVAHSDYAVPETLDSVLRPYQKTGFRWLKTLESYGFGGILADEMGLGKTVEVIAFLCTARRADRGLPSLIVCPTSLVLNWADEFTKFAPQLRILRVDGTAAERKAQIEQDEECDVWVTSYDLLKRDSELYEQKRFYACALDEAQMIKNLNTLASRAVKGINCVQRFVLTGTPIENRLSELWNLFDFLMPGYLYGHTEFVSRLERPIIKSNDDQCRQQLSRLVKPFMLRRLKKDVLRELPPKIEYTRKLMFSEEERRIYTAELAAARNFIADGAMNKIQIFALLTRLRQICCDPALCFENYAGESSKLDACLELCRGAVDNGHQVLLFSQFTSMLVRIQARLKKMNISCFVLQGDTPRKERARLVAEFNNGAASVFLISLKAGGTGLNLTAADVVIHYDPWWNLAVENQATDRAHRIGQKAHVQVYKLIVEGTIEEQVLALQEKKRALMENVAASAEGDIMSMNSDDLLALLGGDDDTKAPAVPK